MAEPTSMILDLAVGEVGEVPLERYGTAGYAWEVLPPPPGLAPPELVRRPGGAGESAPRRSRCCGCAPPHRAST